MRDTLTKFLACTLPLATVLLTAACSGATPPSATRGPAAAATTSGSMPATAGAADPDAGSATPTPTWTVIADPTGPVPSAELAPDKGSMRALSANFDFSSFSEHELKTWDITLKSTPDDGSRSDMYTALGGNSVKGKSHLFVFVYRNKQQAVTAIGCGYSQGDSATATQFMDDCARTQLTGVSSAQVVAYIQEERQLMTPLLVGAAASYSAPYRKIGSDTFSFLKGSGQEVLNIRGDINSPAN
ncbi:MULTISPECIES: hypothetical protein [Streptacidiphilus]|uniref:Lipoprotein n=1 Tax=Streptacidiphilus cavernicola TaxID=3342716 RepID=A0ABV6UUF6_9ACTN|nr:hypothetical protein [Streptacidiphilus jeojiense]